MNFKSFYLFPVFFFFFIFTRQTAGAQIMGSDTVCPGYIYTYTVSMPGAAAFKWYLPVGWYFFSGQGTDSVVVNCNQTADTIRVTGRDSTGALVDSVKMALYWGGGGPAWYVTGYQIGICDPSTVLSIASQGNPCGPGGCGNGYQNPNVVFAAYDNLWPYGNYLGIVNGYNNFSTWNPGGEEVYVYEVDITFGIYNAILVTGGLGCPPQNTYYIPGPPDNNVYVDVEPNPACYGDTVVAYYDAYYYGFSYCNVYSSLTMIQSNCDSSVFIMNDSTGNITISFFATDYFGCQWGGNGYVEASTCHKPRAGFYSDRTSVCSNSYNCVFFYDTSAGPASQWNWSFPGGTPSSSSYSSNEICYSTPGVYPVTLIATNQYGSDTITMNNYITANGPPSVTVTPDTSICKGAIIQLNSSGGSSYSWNPPFWLSNRFAANTTATPLSTTTYVVDVVDSNGCEASGTVTITVNQVPVANAGPDTAMCFGASVQLHGSGGSTYIWSPSSGLSDSTIASPFASPDSTTKYALLVSNSGGCTGSDTVIITINTLPVIAVNADTALCIGASVQLSASGGLQYRWSPAIGLSDSAISNPVANPLTTTVYTVTGTGANGCIGVDSTGIIINYLPVISLTGDTGICFGSSAQLFASGGVMYIWSPAAGLSDSTMASPLAGPSVNTEYMVRVTDINGCRAEDSVKILVNPLPIVTVSGDTALCAGASAQLSSSGGVSCLWSPSAGLNDSTIYDPVATPAITTNYVVMVTDSNFCSSAAAVMVTVNPLPVVELNNDTSLCYGSFIQLDASGGTGYTWTPSAGLSNDTMSDPVAAPLQTTTYSLQVADANGCEGSGAVTLTIYPQTPPPYIYQNGSVLSFYSDSSYASYQWFDSSTIIAGATDTFYVATQDGNYNVEIIDVNGCVTSVGINVVILRANDQSIYELNLSPNPVSDKLQLSMGSRPAEGMPEISIYNLLGERTSVVCRQNAKGVYTIDVSGFSAGIYFLQLKAGEANGIKKFVKE